MKIDRHHLETGCTCDLPYSLHRKAGECRCGTDNCRGCECDLLGYFPCPCCLDRVVEECEDEEPEPLIDTEVGGVKVQVSPTLLPVLGLTLPRNQIN